MRILLVEPGKHPRITEIDGSLEQMQKTVGGYIQAVYPWDDNIALVCDEEALYKDSEWNRYICEGLAIKGTFFICGIDGENFADLPMDLAEKYLQLLYAPQVFIRTASGVVVLDV